MHFHYVLSMGAVFALFAGFSYWTPKIIGKTYNELLGKIHFWVLFLGVNEITQIYINLISYFIYILLSKPITLNEILDNNIKDTEDNDIDDVTLDNKLNSFPTPQSPNPNKGKNKLIFEKLNNIQAEAKFIDLKESKKEILVNTKGKAGVYMFFNLINGKCYVGSSIYLDRIFRTHISSVNSLKSPLPLAINKYGPNNFVFLILQYCEADVNICVGLEQHYIDLYKPQYNLLKIAGSSQGFKYSPETIAKLKKLHSGKLHPRFNTKASEQQKLLTGLGGTKITMRSANGEVLSFPSINATRHHFRIRFTTISLNINQNKPILIKGVKWFVYSETET